MDRIFTPILIFPFEEEGRDKVEEIDDPSEFES